MILRRLKGLPGFSINRHSFNICCTDSEEKLKVLLNKIFREGKMLTKGTFQGASYNVGEIKMKRVWKLKYLSSKVINWQV